MQSGMTLITSGAASKSREEDPLICFLTWLASFCISFWSGSDSQNRICLERRMARPRFESQKHGYFSSNRFLPLSKIQFLLNFKESYLDHLWLHHILFVYTVPKRAENIPLLRQNHIKLAIADYGTRRSWLG